jgi:chromosomal replication initiator protein
VELIAENRAAVQAVMGLLHQLARGRAVSYPVVIYGPPGSGKSQLVHGAVAWWSQRTDAPAWCFSAAECGERLAEVEEGLLIVEDLQHLAWRDAETLCQVLDRRRAFGYGSILTSGRAVAELQHLPRRLTSRLSAGLVVPVWPAGPDSRRRIVAAMAHRWQLPLTEQQVRQLSDSSEGLRSALGQLQRLRQQVSWDGSPTASTLTPLIEQLCQETESFRPSLWDEVLQQVCAVFGVSRRELLSPSRLGRVLLPRQVAMYVLRQAGWSLPRLARAFARDHATILHACRKVEQRLQTDASLCAALRRVQARLH